jgi:seryl-tRNA synthetase
MSPSFKVADGLATLGPELLQVRDALERRLLRWADDSAATRMAFPPLIPVRDLELFGYLDNFPHLALMASPLRTGEAAEPAASGARWSAEGAVATERLAPSGAALASAACYHVYLHLRDTTLDTARYVTTVATCYRNEQRYDGLRRLQAFTMREIVCVGSGDEVRDHVAAFKPRIVAFARSLGLELEIRPATDPFFEPGGGRALLQRLFPVKEEFVFDDSLAVASVNFHRNFFGEKCDIRLADGGPAFTGCVAFGLERWLAALLDVHKDPETILGVLAGIPDE